MNRTTITWNKERAPALGLRLAAAAAIYLPWKLLYATMSRMPEPANPLLLRLTWETDIPRPDFAIWIYAAAILFVLGAPLTLRNAFDLKRFVLAGWLIALIGLSTYWLMPTKAAFLPVEASGTLAALRDAMRTFDAEWLAFPSFHSAWAMLAAHVYARRWPRLWILWLACTAAIGASCLMTGSHALADVLAGFLVAAFVWRLAAPIVATRQRFGSNTRPQPTTI
jgi:membrane-associated phospholipid phosphatase